MFILEPSPGDVLHRWSGLRSLAVLQRLMSPMDDSTAMLHGAELGEMTSIAQLSGGSSDTTVSRQRLIPPDHPELPSEPTFEISHHPSQQLRTPILLRNVVRKISR